MILTSENVISKSTTSTTVKRLIVSGWMIGMDDREHYS